MAWKQSASSFLSLFTSTGTLLCCALPATLAAIAGGAAVSVLISVFPWLIPLSIHKHWLFIIAALLLILNGIFIFRPQSKWVCKMTGDSGCEVAGRMTRNLFFISLTIYLVGAFFAYALAPLMQWAEASSGGFI